MIVGKMYANLLQLVSLESEYRRKAILYYIPSLSARISCLQKWIRSLIFKRGIWWPIFYLCNPSFSIARRGGGCCSSGTGSFSPALRCWHRGDGRFHESLGSASPSEGSSTIGACSSTRWFGGLRFPLRLLDLVDILLHLPFFLFLLSLFLLLIFLILFSSSVQGLRLTQINTV